MRSTVIRWVFSVESWSGRSISTRLVIGASADGIRCRRGTSSQSSRADGSSEPQQHAIGSDVVGRVTPDLAS